MVVGRLGTAACFFSSKKNAVLGFMRSAGLILGSLAGDGHSSSESTSSWTLSSLMWYLSNQVFFALTSSGASLFFSSSTKKFLYRGALGPELTFLLSVPLFEPIIFLSMGSR